MYKKYNSLLDNSAKQDILAFLKEKHSLQGFTKVGTYIKYKNNFFTFIKFVYLSTVVSMG